MTSQIGSSAERQDPWVRHWVDVAERAAQGGFWTYNFKTRDVYCTNTCRSMYSIPDAMFIDSAVWARRVHQDDRMSVNAFNSEVGERRDIQFEKEFRFIGREGDCRWVCSHGEITYDASGQPENMIGFDIDITSKKQADDALERSERLVVAGRFAAVVAHEINNPLEAVNNLVYLAKMENSIERLREYLTFAENELARVQTISRQTLSFYRESNSFEIFEIGDVIETCLNVLDGRIKAKQVRLVLRVHSPAPLYAKRGEILQVLLNLLTNAIEAVQPAGCVQIAADREGTRVRIAVSDDGSGIIRANRKRVFQPFFTTKGSHGTGLGLWVSRAIVQRHLGTIRVRSNSSAERAGTLFLISLPSGISSTPA